MLLCALQILPTLQEHFGSRETLILFCEGSIFKYMMTISFQIVSYSPFIKLFLYNLGLGYSEVHCASVEVKCFVRVFW
jgi:hypothetical protein